VRASECEQQLSKARAAVAAEAQRRTRAEESLARARQAAADAEAGAERLDQALATERERRAAAEAAAGDAAAGLQAFELRAAQQQRDSEGLLADYESWLGGVLASRGGGGSSCSRPGSSGRLAGSGRAAPRSPLSPTKTLTSPRAERPLIRSVGGGCSAACTGNAPPWLRGAEPEGARRARHAGEAGTLEPCGDEVSRVDQLAEMLASRDRFRV
jgi:hypothetical protein